MVKQSIQSYLEMVTGLGEMTRSRAKEAANELLQLSGVEASSKKAAKQASTLADELMNAAEDNRRQIVKVVRKEVDKTRRRMNLPRSKDVAKMVRKEVDKALSRVDTGKVPPELAGVATTVAALSAQVEELAAQGRDPLVRRVRRAPLVRREPRRPRAPR